jgi:hypothetical protein
MILRWETWLHGLGSAAIGGAATALGAIVVKPEVFNLGKGLSDLLEMAAVGGLIAAASYLKQSPLPAIKERADTE